MAYLVQDQSLTSLADAIRTKSGTAGQLEFPAGFVSAVEGISAGSANLQSKTVTPSESPQTVSPDIGYTGLSKVEVGAISNTYVGSGVPQKAAATYTPSTVDQTIDPGQYLTGAQTIRGDANLTAANIKSGVSIFGVTGTGGTNLKRYEGTFTTNTSGKASVTCGFAPDLVTIVFGTADWDTTTCINISVDFTAQTPSTTDVVVCGWTADGEEIWEVYAAATTQGFTAEVYIWGDNWTYVPAAKQTFEFQAVKFTA